MKKELKLKAANAIYTGGGIYVFHGELESGLFTMSDSEYYDESTLIVDVNPNEYFDDIYYPEFQEKHTVKYIYGNESLEYNKNLLTWILENEPKEGNYNLYDIEKILDGMKEENN